MSTELPYQAYGDESCGPDVVTYAFALFERGSVTELENAVAQTKIQFGGQADSAIHCRELFSGHERAKGAWQHLDLLDVIALYNATLDAILPSLHSATVCYALKVDMPAEIGLFDDQGRVSPMPNSKGDGTAALGEKEIASFCAMGAAIPVVAAFGESNVAIYAAPERSKIRRFGRREKFDRTIRGLLGRKGNTLRFEASTSAPAPVLFEVADCFAYFPQKTIMISTEPPLVEERVRALRDRIPFTKARLAFPDGRMAIHID